MDTQLQLIGTVFIALSYLVYLKQIIKGESTPNASTWTIWFIIIGISTASYFQVVDNNYFKTAIIFLDLIGITIIMFYSFFKGKFAKLTKLDIFLLLMSLFIAIFWQMSNDAKLSNLLLQIIIFTAFIPTVVGLWQKRLKEVHLSWTLCMIAYLMQTISLLVDYDGNIYAFASPLINGVIGNGLIPAMLLYQHFDKKKRKV